MKWCQESHITHHHHYRHQCSECHDEALNSPDSDEFAPMGGGGAAGGLSVLDESYEAVEAVRGTLGEEEKDETRAGEVKGDEGGIELEEIQPTVGGRGGIAFVSGRRMDGVNPVVSSQPGSSWHGPPFSPKDSVLRSKRAQVAKEHKPEPNRTLNPTLTPTWAAQTITPTSNPNPRPQGDAGRDQEQRWLVHLPYMWGVLTTGPSGEDGRVSMLVSWERA